MRVTRTLAALVAGIVASIGFTVGAAPAQAAPLAPVEKLDVDRYLGKWWQLATVPSFWGVTCARDTSAFYTRIDAKTIGVDNQCTGPTGMKGGVIGQATVVDTKSNAQLSVRFPQTPASINPNGAPNYIVAHLEDGGNPDGPYKYSIVGDPTRASGFLLSRDKVVSNSELRRLTKEIEKVGFNPCTFLVSPTTGGRSDYSPLCTI
ncbi:lipocalin family protein [Gordonia westfalica]|uniref:Apolipoprotein D and lipocalin family protein n=1 Tax=Gordonia westfalica TaxID=158898 RepID=A0A1H2KJJ5_9ACTN|nr:lipocalin family protein [Gordonia westfalica]SDU68586.1 apolipoprotein D and lipocalin family protein [Gordonia westfalica]